MNLASVARWYTFSEINIHTNNLSGLEMLLTGKMLGSVSAKVAAQSKDLFSVIDLYVLN